MMRMQTEPVKTECAESEYQKVAEAHYKALLGSMRLTIELFEIETAKLLEKEFGTKDDYRL